MRVLLTGGAGYVGSACFRAFRRKGLEAFVFDDLSEGHAAAVEPDRLDVGDLRDTEAVARVLRDRDITHVVHFAAKTSVPESLQDPSGYWSTNVDGSRSLLEAMRATGVGRIVFSSTAAVYAHGLDRPIRETDTIRPATPYGTSKLAVEHLLQGYAEGYGFGATALRYFNACGADADGDARRGPPAGDPRHPADAPDRPRPARRLQGLRRPLADARRHLHPRLRLGARSRRGAPARAAQARAGQDGEPQPRLGRRHQRAGAPRRGEPPCGAAGAARGRGSRVPAIRRSSSPTSPAPAPRSAGSRGTRGSTASSTPPGAGTAAPDARPTARRTVARPCARQSERPRQKGPDGP